MKSFLIAIALAVAGCATQTTSSSDGQSTELGFTLLEAGLRELPKNAKRAKEEYFDKVIELCEKSFDDSQKRFFYARTPAESLFYLMKAAAEETPASVINAPCAEAHYLSGYASLDLGRVEEAEDRILKALEWSPVNPQFKSELGHIKQIQKDWNAALEMFTEAEGNTSAFSPEEVRNAELTRAKRGIGYTLIELGRLDEAEAKFKECLEINANDEGAQHELKYIAELRGKAQE